MSMPMTILKPQIKPRLMSKEELTKLIDQKYQRRVFIVSDIKEYVTSIPSEKAFALSRLLPKEILEKLLSAYGAEAFGNNIIEYFNKISVEGKIPEAVVKQVEEDFLVTHSNRLLEIINGNQ
jgi:hypothetical protein